MLTPPERCLLIGDEASCDVIRAKFARLPSLHVVVVALAAPEHLLWGPLFQELRQLAGPSVTFHGGASDETVVELMEGCSALCVAAEEDFGIAAVEAQAAGKPVIAYGRGGSLETIDEGVTGVFFRKRTEDSVIAAFGACERLDFSPERIAERAQRYSRAAFRARLAAVLEEALERRAADPASGPSVAFRAPSVSRV